MADLRMVNAGQRSSATLFTMAFSFGSSLTFAEHKCVEDIHRCSHVPRCNCVLYVVLQAPLKQH